MGIHGVLMVDHNAGQFGGGRLRHKNVHLTEMHIQTPEMAAKWNPGVMLNLEHSNMTQLNVSGVDDSKLDWRRIPSTDGTCVCVPYPAGLPYFEGAYDSATYKG